MFFIALILCALTLAGYFLFFKSPSQSKCSNNSNNVEETSSTPVGATAFKTGATVAEKTPVLTGATSREKVSEIEVVAPKFEDRYANENKSSEASAGETIEKGTTLSGHQPDIDISDNGNQSPTSNVQEEVLNVSPNETPEDATDLLLTAALPVKEEEFLTSHLQEQQHPAVVISQPVDNEADKSVEKEEVESVVISQAAEELTAAPVEERDVASVVTSHLQEQQQPAVVISQLVEDVKAGSVEEDVEPVVASHLQEQQQPAVVISQPVEDVTAGSVEEEDVEPVVTSHLQEQQQQAIVISQEAVDLTAAPVEDEDVEAVTVTSKLLEQQQPTVAISEVVEDLTTTAPVEENNIHSVEVDNITQENHYERESQDESLIQGLNPEEQSQPETKLNSCTVQIKVTEPEPFFQTEILPENEIFQNEIQNEQTEFQPITECQNHIVTESENSNSETDISEKVVKFSLGELSQEDLYQTEIENKIINNIHCDGEEKTPHIQEMSHDVTLSHQQIAGGITRSAPVKCSSGRSSQNSFSSLSKIVEYDCEDLSVTPKNDDDSHFQNEIDGKILMNERSDSIDEIVEAKTLQIFSDREKPKLKRQETMYDSAEVVTFVSRMNICCAIFKNPADHRTHYYRKRFKVPKDEVPIPTELRNIAASFRVWGKHWERIHHIKICQKSCASLEEPSKAVHRLEDQREDCQNKFGCRISLQDFDTLGTLDKKVLGDLLEKIHNNFVSEDDLAYFNLQDDSEAVDKYYFDL